MSAFIWPLPLYKFLADYTRAIRFLRLLHGTEKCSAVVNESLEMLQNITAEFMINLGLQLGYKRVIRNSLIEVRNVLTVNPIQKEAQDTNT